MRWRLLAEKQSSELAWDVFWDNLPVLLSGAAQTITGIHGSTCALADEYGDWVLKALQIGASPAAVAKSALHPFPAR